MPPDTSLPMSTGVQSKMFIGAGWMLLLQLFDRVLGLISILVLVRLLAPADFGIVAMGISFVAMAEVLTAFRLDVALIQHPNPSEEHYHSAWTCNVLFGFALMCLLIAMAWPAAQFYGQAEVFWVVCALALCPLLTALENIGIVRFRKELQFQREFTFRASRRLIAFVVALPLAFLMRNYWALVGGILVTRFGGSVLSYIAHDFRPRFCLTKVRELFGFSIWILFNNVVCFFKEYATDFFIGRLHGPLSLGLYGISHEISSVATTDLSASINRALVPGFVKVEIGVDFRTVYRNAMGILTLIALPAAAGVYAIAPFLVPVALGSNWLESTPLVEVLALNGGVVVLHSSIGAVLMARGYPQDNVKANSCYVVLLFAMLAVFVPYHGVVGAAYAALGTAAVMTPIFLYLIRRRLDVEVQTFASAIARPFVASVLMVLIVRKVLPDYEFSMSFERAASLLIYGIVVGIAVYSVVVVLLWVIAGRPVSAERIVLERIRKAVTDYSRAR